WDHARAVVRHGRRGVARGLSIHERLHGTHMTTAATLLSELEAQLEAQRRAFARGAPDHRRRMQALAALRDGMHARQEELVRAVSDDFGGRPARSKPRRCAAFSETKSYTAAPHSALPRAQ